MTIAELFSSLRDSIWTEVPARPAPGSAPAVNSFRRALQRRHLDYLIFLGTNEVAGAPKEATTMARADLADLKSRLAAALKAASLEAPVRAHLAESAARIDQALDAKYLRS
jgi:hypothetical protein